MEDPGFHRWNIRGLAPCTDGSGRGSGWLAMRSESLWVSESLQKVLEGSITDGTTKALRGGAT